MPVLIEVSGMLKSCDMGRYGVKTPWQLCGGRLSCGMNLLLVLLVLLLLFGGGGFYFGGPIIGGSGIGLILLICLIVYIMGGFRAKA